MGFPTRPVSSGRTAIAHTIGKTTNPAESPHRYRQPEQANAPQAEIGTREILVESAQVTPVTRTDEVDIDLDAIAAVLSHLKLNEKGQLQLDRHVRANLDAAFLRPSAPMGEEQFADLKSLIIAGLPGDAGRQAAAVAQRYFHYSNAYRDIADTFENLASPEDIQRGFQQLNRLRRDHLGADVARALFGEEERMTQYTLEIMRIQSDPELSAEEKNTLQEQLQQPFSEPPKQKTGAD